MNDEIDEAGAIVFGKIDAAVLVTQPHMFKR